MSEKNKILDDEKINKINFYENKKIFIIDDTDVNKILICKKWSFIGYSYNDEIELLCIKLLQMIGYANYFDSHKTMSFKASDSKLFKKYPATWGKVISLINIKLGSEPVYSNSDKYINKKIKSYRDKVNTNFKAKKCQKKMHHTNVCQ